MQRQQPFDDDELTRLDQYRAGELPGAMVVDGLEDRLAPGEQLQVLLHDLYVIAVGVQRGERQGIMAVTFPLVMEFSWQRTIEDTIEDRALAPVPIRVLAIQKIVAGAVQSFIGAVIVFPIVLFVHAAGQAPHVHVTNWALFALILVFASLLTSALGLLLGTIMDPRKMQMLFAVILLPATMLGCVYYPWAALHNIRWLQIAVLVNPMVYMSEGLRAVLTPVLPHMPMWAVLFALVGGTVVFGYLGTRTFTRRVLTRTRAEGLRGLPRPWSSLTPATGKRAVSAREYR